MKLKLIIAAAATTLITLPSFAQDMVACDEDSLNLVAAQVEGAGEDKKAMAMEELEMAKTKMTEGDAEACSVHLTNASKASMEQ